MGLENGQHGVHALSLAQTKEDPVFSRGSDSAIVLNRPTEEELAKEIRWSTETAIKHAVQVIQITSIIDFYGIYYHSINNKYFLYFDQVLKN